MNSEDSLKPSSQEQNTNFSAEGNVTVESGSNLDLSNTVITNITYQTSTRVDVNIKLTRKSPYKGLEPFKDSDASVFFGREKKIEEQSYFLLKNHWLLVSGASGSGKSSFVWAGLIPALDEYFSSQSNSTSSDVEFISLRFKPEKNPFESFYFCLQGSEFRNLKTDDINAAFNWEQGRSDGEVNKDTLLNVVETLKSPQSCWCLFIDQFEQIFTNSDPEYQIPFIQGLQRLYNGITANSESVHRHSFKVIMTIRTEFLSNLGVNPYSEFGTRLQSKHLLPLPTDMSKGGLREVIENPAHMHGVTFEKKTGKNIDLVQTIIDDVYAQKGSLPLLQYTLHKLWQESHVSKDNRELKEETYNKLGGVQGALKKRVDAIYKRFKEAKQEDVFRQVLLKLADLRYVNLDDPRVFRRRAYKDEFVEREKAQLVLDTLKDENLILADTDTEVSKDSGARDIYYEVTHEALLRSWEPLKQWIADTSEVVKLKRLLEEESKEWKEKVLENSDFANEQLIWRGARLAKAIEFRENGSFDSVLENLQPVEIEFLDAGITKKKEEEEARLQNERRLKQAAQKVAESAQKAAAAEKARAKAEEKEANNAREAQKIAEEKADAERQSKESIQRKNRFLSFLLTSLALATFSSCYQQQKARLSEARTSVSNAENNLQSEQKLDALVDSLRASKIFHKPRLPLLLGDQTDLEQDILSVLYQSAHSIPETHNFQGTTEELSEVRMGANDQLFGVRENGRLFQAHWGSQKKINTVFSSDKLLTRKASEGLSYLEISPDSSKLAGLSENGMIQLWEMSKDGPLREKNTIELSSSADFHAMKFSPDGKKLAIVEYAAPIAVIRLWDFQLNTYETLEFRLPTSISNTFQLETGFVNTTPILVVSEIEPYKRVTVFGPTARETVPIFQQLYRQVYFSPDGRRMVASNGKELHLWNLEKWTYRTLPSSIQNSISDISVIHFSSRQASFLVASGRQGFLINYDGQEVDSFDIRDANITALTSSQDDHRKVAIGTDNGSIYLVSSGAVDSHCTVPETCEQYVVEERVVEASINLLSQLKGHKDVIETLAFTEDNDQLISVDQDGILRSWTLSGNLPTEILRVPEAMQDYTVEFSHDGQYSLYRKPLDFSESSSNNNTNIYLFKRDDSGLMEITLTNVLNAEFDPTGKNLIVQWNNGKLSLFSLEDINANIALNANNAAINFRASITDVKISSNGEYFLLSDTIENQLQLYKWNRQQEFIPLEDREGDSIEFKNGEFSKTVFSPDSRHLLVSTEEKGFALYRFKGRNRIDAIGTKSSLVGAKFSPAGNYLIGRSTKEKTSLWKFDYRHLFKLRSKPFSQIMDNVEGELKFSSNDQYLILFNKEGEFQELLMSKDDFSNSLKFANPSIPKECKSPTNFEFGPNSRYLKTRLSLSERIRQEKSCLWFLRDNSLHLVKQPDDEFIFDQFTFSSDGLHIAVGANKQYSIWKLNKAKALTMREEQPLSFNVSFTDQKALNIPEGYMLGSSDEGFLWWDSKKNKGIPYFGAWNNGSEVVKAVDPVHKDIITATNFSISLRKTDHKSLRTWGCFWVRNHLQLSENLKRERNLCKGIGDESAIPKVKKTYRTETPNSDNTSAEVSTPKNNSEQPGSTSSSLRSTQQITVNPLKQSEFFQSVTFPQPECGDSLPTESEDYPLSFYPVFVEYSSDILSKIQNQFCKDAFSKKRAKTQSQVIQVASFSSKEKADEFVSILRYSYGAEVKPEVGEAKEYKEKP